MQALVTYMDSLRETRELPAKLVLSGHGDPIEDHVALIDERFRMHERRAEKIRGLIAERPRTAHDIAQELWGTFAVTQAFLTLSEVLGHVDLSSTAAWCTRSTRRRVGLRGHVSVASSTGPTRSSCRAGSHPGVGRHPRRRRPGAVAAASLHGLRCLDVGTWTGSGPSRWSAAAPTRSMPSTLPTPAAGTGRRGPPSAWRCRRDEGRGPGVDVARGRCARACAAKTCGLRAAPERLGGSTWCSWLAAPAPAPTRGRAGARARGVPRHAGAAETVGSWPRCLGPAAGGAAGGRRRAVVVAAQRGDGAADGAGGGGPRGRGDGLSRLARARPSAARPCARGGARRARRPGASASRAVAGRAAHGAAGGTVGRRWPGATSGSRHGSAHRSWRGARQPPSPNRRPAPWSCGAPTSS